MAETSAGGTAFEISIGLAFIGGYADAASFLLAHTFTGHLTGNCVLGAVSAASKEWNLAADRLLAATVFIAGILFSLAFNRFLPVQLKRYSLAMAMFVEVFLIMSAGLLLANKANNELFIVCMCLALGIQNDALHKTNGISVHSTYMTGMVTTLIQKGFQHWLPMQDPKADSTSRSPDLTIRILSLTWLSFLIGAVTGALMIVSFGSSGLLVVVLPLSVLIYVELKRK
ncbi:MAG: DUF1275 domain-containing protein [Verrucomicrobia bacterium]|nr:DUF1275 domain-containing protein [Verrucomicrobiota bacterium]